MTTTEKAKSVLDWFLDKNKGNQVLLIMIMIIAILGYFSYQNLQDAKVELQSIKMKVEILESDVRDLTQENFKLKYNSILLLDADKFNPNPEFIVSAEDYKVMWVNSAYERRHLSPKGATAIDLIGTDGTLLFGAGMVKIFKQNNDIVKSLGRAMSFDNELNKTVRYPISKGGVIYAIKGSEWIEHH